MKRHQVRRVVIEYLEDFLSNILLYKEFPVKQKMRNESLAQDIYEQLNDEERIEIHEKVKRNDNGN